MSKFDVKENIGSVQTEKEFKELLEVYAKQNPEKHAQKLASGVYDKFKAGLVKK